MSNNINSNTSQHHGYGDDDDCDSNDRYYDDYDGAYDDEAPYALTNVRAGGGKKSAAAATVAAKTQLNDKSKQPSAAAPAPSSKKSTAAVSEKDAPKQDKKRKKKKGDVSSDDEGGDVTSNKKKIVANVGGKSGAASNAAAAPSAPSATKSTRARRGDEENGGGVDVASKKPSPSHLSPSSPNSSSHHTPADKVFARLSWDESAGFRLKDFDVGYEDRFVGLRFMRAHMFRNDENNKNLNKKKGKGGAKASSYDGDDANDDGDEAKPFEYNSNDDDGDDDEYDVYQKKTNDSQCKAVDCDDSSSDSSDGSVDANFRKFHDDDYGSSSDDDGDSFKCADKFKPPRPEAKNDAEAQRRAKQRLMQYAPKDTKGSDIPFHRVRCFRRAKDGLIVWDREKRIDLLDSLAAAHAAKVLSGEAAEEKARAKEARRARKKKEGKGKAENEGSSSAAVVGPSASSSTTQSALAHPAPQDAPHAELKGQLTDGFKLLRHLQTKPLAVYGPVVKASSSSLSSPSASEDCHRLLLPAPLLSVDTPEAQQIVKDLKSSSLSPHNTTTTSLKVLTFNVLHPFYKSAAIYSEERYSAHLLEAMASSGADIICLQEVTPQLAHVLIGGGQQTTGQGVNNNDNDACGVTNNNDTDNKSDALTILQTQYWWTALPSAAEEGASKTSNSAAAGFSSQLIGSKFPILGAGSYFISKGKRHVLAVVADPLWCRSLSEGGVEGGPSSSSSAATASLNATRRVKPAPIVVCAAHLVSDFAGPNAAGLRVKQMEDLFASMSSSPSASLRIPPFRAIIGIDCNFGDQSEEMNRIQYALASADRDSSGWWGGSTRMKNGNDNDAPAEAPRQFHDAWLRQYYLTPTLSSSSSSSSSSEGAAKPFAIVKAEDVPLMMTNNSNVGGGSKGSKPSSKAPLDLSDATKAAAAEETARLLVERSRGGNDNEASSSKVSVRGSGGSVLPRLSPIGGFTFDASRNALAAVMTEKHFYPRRLDRIFYNAEAFCLRQEEEVVEEKDYSSSSAETVPSVQLIGTEATSAGRFPSDHFGVLAALSIRPFFYTATTTALVSAPTARVNTTAAATTTALNTATVAPAPPAEFAAELDPRILTSKAKEWSVASSPSVTAAAAAPSPSPSSALALDRYVSCHLLKWEASVIETPRLAAVRNRIVNKLGQITGQWAAYTALKAERERRDGVVLPEFWENNDEKSDDDSEDDDDDYAAFDHYAFCSEARKKYTSRLFVTGSTAMGTHVRGSDIDALLVLPGADSTYDEWFNRLVAFLRHTMLASIARKEKAMRADDDDDSDDVDEEDVPWLHAVVPTPQTSKVPIIRLQCTDPAGGRAASDSDDDANDDDEEKEDCSRVVFEVEFGLAVVRGYDKVPNRQDLCLAALDAKQRDFTVADDSSFHLLGSCCKEEPRSVLSFDGLRNSSAIVDRYLFQRPKSLVEEEAKALAQMLRINIPVNSTNSSISKERGSSMISSVSFTSSPIVTVLRFVKAWAAARLISGINFGYPSGIGWALMVVYVAQLSPLLSAGGLLRRFYQHYAALFGSIAAPSSSSSSSSSPSTSAAAATTTVLYLNSKRPRMTREEEAAIGGIRSWDPSRSCKDAAAVFPVLLPTAPFRNVCDKVTRHTAAVLADEMRRALSLLEDGVYSSSGQKNGNDNDAQEDDDDDGKGASSVGAKALAAILQPFTPIIVPNTTTAVIHIRSATRDGAAAAAAAAGTLQDTITEAATSSSSSMAVERRIDAAVQWRLRQNRVESLLPNLLEEIDALIPLDSVGVKARSLAKRFLNNKITAATRDDDANNEAGQENKEALEGGGGVCHHIVLLSLPSPAAFAALSNAMPKRLDAFNAMLMRDYDAIADEAKKPFTQSVKLVMLCGGGGVEEEVEAVLLRQSAATEASSSLSDVFDCGATFPEIVLTTAEMDAHHHGSGTVAAAAAVATSDKRSEKKALKAARKDAALSRQQREKEEEDAKAKKPQAKPSPHHKQQQAEEVYEYSGPPLQPADFTFFTRTALVILPPREWWEGLNAYRSSLISGAVADRSYPRWMPHITLLFPFVQPRHIQEAIRRIEAWMGMRRVHDSRITAAPPLPSNADLSSSSLLPPPAPPTVERGLSQFEEDDNKDEQGGGSSRRERLVRPFAYHAPTLGTFDHGKGASVVFIEPHEEKEHGGDGDCAAANTNSTPTSTSTNIMEGGRGDEAQRLYRSVAQLFPRCGRTPLLRDENTRGGRGGASGGGEEEGEDDSSSFHPHITLARTGTAKDTALFTQHVKATWPQSIVEPTLATYEPSLTNKKGAVATTAAAASSSFVEPRWEVKEFHLIAHLNGTDAHQIIHTFKL